MSDSRALFVRLPLHAAEHLDQITSTSGVSKREVVTCLILGEELSVGQHNFQPAPEPAALTPSLSGSGLAADRTRPPTADAERQSRAGGESLFGLAMKRDAACAPALARGGPQIRSSVAETARTTSWPPASAESFEEPEPAVP